MAANLKNQKSYMRHLAAAAIARINSAEATTMEGAAEDCVKVEPEATLILLKIAKVALEIENLLTVSHRQKV